MLTTAAFLQDEWSLTEDTRLIGGMRYTYVDSEFNGSDDPTLVVTDPKSNDSNLAFSLGAVQQINKEWSLRANYSQGYRHPNLVELYIGSPAHGRTPAKDGNPDLDPETSHSFEVGTLYRGSNLSSEFAVFYTTAKDYIATDATHYTNIGGADTIGAEWSVGYLIGDSGLTPYATLTALHRELDYDDSTTSDSGVAPFSGRYGVRYVLDVSTMSYLNFDLFGRSSSKVDMLYADGSRDSADDWTTANLEVSYVMDELFGFSESYPVSMEIYGGIYNIFNADYTPFDELQAAERHFVAGVNLTF